MGNIAKGTIIIMVTDSKVITEITETEIITWIIEWTKEGFISYKKTKPYY